MKKKKELSISHEKAEAQKRKELWDRMATISLESAVSEWLSSMLPITQKNYLSGMRMLAEFGILDLKKSIQEVSLLNHDTILDKISSIQQWSDCSKQARAAAYISLTGFLFRKTEGMVKKAVPRKREANRTFFKVREKVKTEALEMNEWKELIKSMEQVNKRDALVAKLCLQGARRIHEVLDLQVSQINQSKRQISFKLNKTRRLVKNVIVTIPQNVMDEITSYLGDRKSGHVFLTSKVKPVKYAQILKSLKKAAITCSIRKRIHTHVLRTSAITYLRSLGFQDFEIQRLTGHSSSQMLNAYDKTSLENNSSQKISLV